MALSELLTASGSTSRISEAIKTYVYSINQDATLSDKKLFVDMGSDGMTIDDEGDIYLTGKGVTVFNAKDEKIDYISIEQALDGEY